MVDQLVTLYCQYIFPVTSQTMVPDECSRDEQDAGPDIVTSPTLQEESPIIISENDDQENENVESEVVTCSMESTGSYV